MQPFNCHSAHHSFTASSPLHLKPGTPSPPYLHIGNDFRQVLHHTCEHIRPPHTQRIHVGKELGLVVDDGCFFPGTARGEYKRRRSV